MAYPTNGATMETFIDNLVTRVTNTSAYPPGTYKTQPELRVLLRDAVKEALKEAAKDEGAA